MVTKLTLEYDGAGFAGWARQPDERSVQEELERALTTILGDTGHDGHPLRVSVAGRTDAGVHAWKEVASYAHEAVDPRRLNGLLPSDIAVLRAEPAGATFDARRDATSRTYCYRVLNSRTRSAFWRGHAFWWTPPLELTLLERCAEAVRGRHDFTAFTPTETEHSWFTCDVRRAEWVPAADARCIDGSPPVRTAVAPGEEERLLEFWIEADMFLRHMNRVLVGTMLDVAAGARPFGEFAELLEGRPRAHAGRTAPAHGLALAAVGYAGRSA